MGREKRMNTTRRRRATVVSLTAARERRRRRERDALLDAVFRAFRAGIAPDDPVEAEPSAAS